MAKRFTESEKWTKNKWFRQLPADYKLLWLYILDNCDCVGVWEEDTELFNTLTGCQADAAAAKKFFSIQIQVFNEGRKWWVRKFCAFQYGVLKEENIKNKPHQRYISDLKKHRLWVDYLKTIHTPEEEDKEEEKEKDKEKEEVSAIQEVGKLVEIAKKGAEKKKRPANLLGMFFKDFSENFGPTAWLEWIKYKQKQHKFTYKAVEYEQQAFDKLYDEVGGSEQAAVQAIQHSIANGYKGIYPPKNNTNEKHSASNGGGRFVADRI